MLRQDVINAHAQWTVLGTGYQRADDPFRIKGVGASEASPTPCNNNNIMVNYSMLQDVHLIDTIMHGFRQSERAFVMLLLVVC